jgi:hypothetical protein
VKARTAAALVVSAAACHWGCYFLVDRSGIAGGSDSGAPSSPAVEAGQVEDGGPIAYWSFDDADGGVVPDQTGKGHDGQLTSAAALADDGERGRALASTMRVSSLEGSSFPLRGTLSFWLRADFTGSDAKGRDIFDQYDLSRAAHLFVRVPIAVRPVDLQVAWQAGTPAYPFVADMPSPSNNAWMHLVVVWDTVDEHTASVYLDGNLRGQGKLPSTWAPSGQTFVFAGNFAGGLIDEARLYDRPLSAAELKGIP